MNFSQKLFSDSLFAIQLVGVRRFELPAPWTPFRYSTKLSHTPTLLKHYNTQRWNSQELWKECFTVMDNLSGLKEGVPGGRFDAHSQKGANLMIFPILLKKHNRSIRKINGACFPIYSKSPLPSILDYRLCHFNIRPKKAFFTRKTNPFWPSLINWILNNHWRMIFIIL